MLAAAEAPAAPTADIGMTWQLPVLLVEGLCKGDSVLVWVGGVGMDVFSWVSLSFG